MITIYEASNLCIEEQIATISIVSTPPCSSISSRLRYLIRFMMNRERMEFDEEVKRASRSHSTRPERKTSKNLSRKSSASRKLFATRSWPLNSQFIRRQRLYRDLCRIKISINIQFFCARGSPSTKVF